MSAHDPLGTGKHRRAPRGPSALRGATYILLIAGVALGLMRFNPGPYSWILEILGPTEFRVVFAILFLPLLALAVGVKLLLDRLKNKS